MISITEAARQEIESHLSNNKYLNCLRIGVRSGGCEGFMYFFTYDVKKEGDLVFGSLVTDEKSLSFINESVLDFENTLMCKQFFLRNPNEQSSCGCGKSFSK